MCGIFDSSKAREIQQTTQLLKSVKQENVPSQRHNVKETLTRIFRLRSEGEEQFNHTFSNKDKQA